MVRGGRWEGGGGLIGVERVGRVLEDLGEGSRAELAWTDTISVAARSSAGSSRVGCSAALNLFAFTYSRASRLHSSSIAAFFLFSSSSIPIRGTPNFSLSLSNLSFTLCVCIIFHRNAHPSTPNSLILAALSPSRYSSNPPTLSIVLNTRLCTRICTKSCSASLQSRFQWMLGRHTRRVLISFFSETLLPAWMREPP